VLAGGSAESDKIVVAYLNVDEAFKGASTQDVVVMTDANNSGGCGFYFEVGKQYLVFAYVAPGSTALQIAIGPAKGGYTPVPPIPIPCVRRHWQPRKADCAAARTTAGFRWYSTRDPSSTVADPSRCGVGAAIRHGQLDQVLQRRSV
jgi:hypothetical protein